MAKYTENYNLEKPEKTEHYDIETANKNNDIIDARLFEKQDKQAGKGLSTNDFTDEYKKKIDALQRIYKYCGSVETVADLDTIEERQIGDVYNVKDTNIDYCWNGTEWTELGNTVDLTNYQTTEQANQDKQKIKDKLVVVSATEPTGDNREKVWIQKGKNLFDGMFRQGTEKNPQATTYIFSRSDMKVVSGNNYTFSSNLDMSIYKYVLYISPERFPNTNANTYNSGFREDNNTCSISATLDGYIGLMIGKKDDTTIEPSDLDEIWFQVDQGSTATEYEAYIEPKMFVKNDNDVYEEFISKEDTLERYSTGEQKIGTWIDGKPLYQKTITITVPTVNANGTSNFNAVLIGSNIETIFLAEGFFKDSTNGNVFPLFYTDGAFQYGIRTYIGVKENAALQVSNSNTSYNGFLGYVTVKYTKTTD